MWSFGPSVVGEAVFRVTIWSPDGDQAAPMQRHPSIHTSLTTNVALSAVFWLLATSALIAALTAQPYYREVDLQSLFYFSFDPVEGNLDDVPRAARDLDGRR